MFLKLAFRNIFRNFRRTILSGLAIAFSLTALIIIDSLLSRIDKESFEKIINYETGHIKIFQKGYKEDKENLPLDKLIEKPQSVVNVLKNDPEIEAFSRRVNFSVLLSDGVDELPATGIAINPQEDEKVFALKEAVEKGEFLSSNEPEMLLGEGLAKDFGVDVGDYLTLLARTKYNTYQALDLKIKGLLKTDDPKIDWYAVVIPLGFGQESLELGDAVTEINIKLKDPSKINEFRDKLAKEITGVEVATWKDLAEDVMAISQTKRGASTIIFLSVTLVALVGISNTILLAAFERTKEIGMMSAMGMKRKQIILLFVFEGALVGFLGSFFGCLIGGVLNYPLVRYGIDYGNFMKDLGDFGYRITSKMYGQWRPYIFLIVLLFGIFVSAIVSIYPAYLAAKVDPIKALRKN